MKIAEGPPARRDDDTTREYVQRAIRYHLGHRKDISAKDLVGLTGLPIALCSYYVKKLCDEGWLVHTRIGDNPVGSPRKYYELA